MKGLKAMLRSSQRRRQPVYEGKLTDNGCSIRMWKFFNAEAFS